LVTRRVSVSMTVDSPSLVEQVFGDSFLEA
jgi:hypothetical protein